jgi:hypothetical protein
MPQTQIIVPHGRRSQAVEIDGAACRRLNTVTLPGQGFDIETWETTEPSPYPTGPQPGMVSIHYAR